MAKTMAEGTYWGRVDTGLTMGGMNSTYTGMVYAGVAVWVGVFLLPVRGADKKEKIRVICLLVAGVLCLSMAFKSAVFRSFVSELQAPVSLIWNCREVSN